jgi:glycosyltransferase involved in cell wall biosynthesis
MTGARVLVLIPSYNHGPFIKARVLSVLNQNLTEVEASIDVRLIDDGSSDGTMAILESIEDERFRTHRRAVNSGSPFTAWVEACDLLREGGHDFIWIAESDDRAAPDFLMHGLSAMARESKAVIYYTHSWYIDERDLIIGHSINYLKKYFPAMSWVQPFTLTGRDFIAGALLSGMAIPNMSSALIRADAFCQAMDPCYANFRLAADWIFAIAVSKLGRIIFDPRDANYFRHHARTARSETNLARVVAEHMSATHSAFITGWCEDEAYRAQMRVWAEMYRHERVSRKEFTELVRKIAPEMLDEFLSFLPR